jgi:hypothetical protein
MPKKIIRKSELAAELGLSRSRVSQLVAMGLPVLPNGLIARAAAHAWYAGNVLPHLGAKKLNPANAVDPAARELVPDGFDGSRRVVELFRAKAAELPRIFHLLGAPPAVVAMVADGIDSFIWAALGDELLEQLYGSSGPAPVERLAPGELARLAGGADEDSARWEAEADRICDKVDDLLGIRRYDASIEDIARVRKTDL